MEVTEDVSWRKVGIRSMIAIVIVGGLLLQRLHYALAVAALGYVAAEGARLRLLSQRHDEAVSEVLTANDLFLRRVVVWVAIVLAVSFQLLIAESVSLAIITAGLTYVAGVFTQAIRRHQQQWSPSAIIGS